MKTLLVELHAFVLAFAATRAGAEVPSAVRADITKAEDAWRQARIAGDVSALDRFYAKEGHMQGIDGKVISRDAHIDIFRTGKIKPKFIDHDPLEIDVYGGAAVVRGVDHLGGTAFGQYGEVYIRFTDVLVKRDGRWQLVVQQGTSTTGI